MLESPCHPRRLALIANLLLPALSLHLQAQVAPPQFDQMPVPAPSGPGLATPSAAKAYLGLLPGQLSPRLNAALPQPTDHGLVIEAMDADGPAAQAGLVETDILLAIDGTPVSSKEEMVSLLARCQPGQQVKLDYLRFGQPQQAQCALGSQPEPERQDQLAQRTPADPLSVMDLSSRQMQALQQMMTQLQSDNLADPAALDSAMEDAFNDMRMSLGTMQVQGGNRTEMKYSDGRGRVEMLETADHAPVLRLYDTQGKLVWQGELRRDQRYSERSLQDIPEAHRERVRSALEMMGWMIIDEPALVPPADTEVH